MGGSAPDVYSKMHREPYFALRPDRHIRYAAECSTRTFWDARSGTPAPPRWRTQSRRSTAFAAGGRAGAWAAELGHSAGVLGQCARERFPASLLKAVAEVDDAAAESVLVDELKIGASVGRQCGLAPTEDDWPDEQGQLVD